MRLFMINATVNREILPAFYVYGFEIEDVMATAKTILSAMIRATGTNSDPWGRTPGYRIKIEET